MGGYLLFNIDFKSKEDRDKFEKNKFKCLGKFKRMFQYKYDDGCECTYYPKWMGYYEPQLILKECKKYKIRIKKFLHVDLSTQSSWFDILKEETAFD